MLLGFMSVSIMVYTYSRLRLTYIYAIGKQYGKEVKLGNDKEMAQSERDSHSINQMGKTKLTVTYLYEENMAVLWHQHCSA